MICCHEIRKRVEVASNLRPSKFLAQCSTQEQSTLKFRRTFSQSTISSFPTGALLCWHGNHLTAAFSSTIPCTFTSLHLMRGCRAGKRELSLRSEEENREKVNLTGQLYASANVDSKNMSTM